MERIEAVRAQLADHDIDAMLVTSGPNRQYMSRFFGTAGMALISKQAAIFITDFRYVEQDTEHAKEYEIIQHKASIYKGVEHKVNRVGNKDLGLEKTVTYKSYMTPSSSIQTATLVPVKG